MQPWETSRAAMPDTALPQLAPDRSAARLTLPNIISFARLCAVPVAIWLLLHRRFAAAFGLFVLAGLSDAIDGWLARRRGATALGAVLDPLADKALMVGMYVTLAATGQVPDWLAILVVFRDLVIVGGVMLLWLTGHPQAISPIPISKVNTALQIGLVAVILGLDALRLQADPLRLAMVVLVSLSTLGSGGAYVLRTARAA
jgi:cardiolipin synthase